MTSTNSQNVCHHQLIFVAALDHAASCARCGAIALIKHKDGVASVTWINGTQQSSQTNASAKLATIPRRSRAGASGARN